jgi:uncharacterized protein
MALQFEWDSAKARSNFTKHDVSFDEASTAFRDVFSITIDDPLHSADEERYILVGLSCRNRLLVVVHTERGGRVRLISARIASRKERKCYEENQGFRNA